MEDKRNWTTCNVASAYPLDATPAAAKGREMTATREELEAHGVPFCDTCGVELTTGLMAVFCPRKEKCEFYPDEPEGQAFVEELRAGIAVTTCALNPAAAWPFPKP